MNVAEVGFAIKTWSSCLRVWSSGVWHRQRDGNKKYLWGTIVVSRVQWSLPTALKFISFALRIYMNIFFKTQQILSTLN